MILKLGYDARKKYVEAVKDYRNEEFGDGWQNDDDDMTMLFNPKTGESCKVYLAPDKDFELDNDCDVSVPFKGLLQFYYPVSDKSDREPLENQFTYIEYYRVISRSFEHMVRLNKQWLYNRDGEFYVLAANPADVVEF